MSHQDTIARRALSRRSFLATAGAGAGVATAWAVTGCGSSSHMPSQSKVTDTDILNFALNLEYLEAEYYLRAATGSGLSDADSGSNAGTVTGGQMVTFATPAIKQYALEIANDELAHVRFLRKAAWLRGRVTPRDRSVPEASTQPLRQPGSGRPSTRSRMKTAFCSVPSCLKTSG